MPLILSSAALVVVLLVHDLVPLGRLNNVAHRRADGDGTVLTTVGNLAPAVAAFAVALTWPSGPLPLGAGAYLVVYLVAFVVLAWTSWYGPYLFGTSEEREAEAEAEYGPTLQLLPRRGTHVRPNLMHLIIHALFVLWGVTVVLQLAAQA